jgi:hypothetical protein
MRKQALDFRKEEAQYVMDRWKASESCALVGVGSVGKSNLLHHLADADTQAHYLGERSQNFKSVMIDPNLLGPIDESDSVQFRCWAGYELLMHRLYLTFYPFDVLGDDAQNFFEAYQALQDGTNPLYAYMGLRYFEHGLEFFFRRGLQIVFMFDEFEEMLRKMPIKFFLTLRGLRDNHKKNLQYLTFSREPLPVLIEKMALPELEIEPFSELFTDNNYYVGPYNREDSDAMIQRLIGRNPSTQYSSATIDFLLYASGRYAGLLRAGFRALEMLGEITAADVTNPNTVARLMRRPRVQTECETIWKSLTDVEQRVLHAIAQRQTDTLDTESEAAIPLLVQKRLLRVNKERNMLQIEPPVLNAYVSDLA